MLAEAVSLSGELILFALVVLLVLVLACATVVVGTVIAARRHARTGSAASGVVALIGATMELYVFAVGALQRAPVTMAIAGGALLAAGIAHQTAKPRPPAT